MLYVIQNKVRHGSYDGGGECNDNGVNYQIVGSKREAVALIRDFREVCQCRKRSCLAQTLIYETVETPKTKADWIRFANRWVVMQSGTGGG